MAEKKQSQKKEFTYCLHKHIAFKLCCESKCRSPAAICNEQKCIYSEKDQNYVHQLCSKDVSINKIMNNMLRNRVLQTQERQIQEFFNRVCEIATNQKQQFLKIIRKPQLRLTQKQTILYKLLKNPNSQLLPPLINKVTDEIFNLKNCKKSSYLFDISKDAEYKMHRIIRELQSMKQYWIGVGLNSYENKKIIAEQLNYVPYQFSNHFSYPGILVKQSKFTKLIKLYDNSDYPVSLVFPSLKSNEKSQIKFRAIKSNHYNFVGIAELNSISKNIHCWTNGSVFVIDGGNGQIFSYSSKQHKVKTKFRFTSGDIIHLTYFPNNYELVIQNQTNGLWQKLLEVKSGRRQPLNFCVVTHNFEDEFEILR